ncbi:DUF2806 domain-containing protein [Pseudomonas parafulva]|uniref:DUF2806 domain-containing protein n=1 Tax=Pseudomonas parafulva TaxID=157782 RepID=UPI0009BF95A5|nr:DUF2806 domain-containing protein [Pseudomonas parafulva]
MKSDEINASDVKVDVSVHADFQPILESAPSGFKRVFQLLFGGRHAKMDRQSRLIEAQTHVDVQKILRGEVQYDPSSNDFVHVDSSVVANFIRQEMSDEESNNLLNCSMHAALTLNSVSPDTDRADGGDEDISRDFVLRWRNEARFISEETAQAIWGRILAEETQRPGSISSRSLDVVKNLSKDEALTFKRACCFVAFDTHLLDNTKGDPLSPVDFTTLRDAGLIASYSQGIYTGSPWPESNLENSDSSTSAVYFLKINGHFIYTFKSDLPSPKAPSFTYWELTKAAKELYQIIKKDIEFDAPQIAKAIKQDESFKTYYMKYVDQQNDIVDHHSVHVL